MNHTKDRARARKHAIILVVVAVGLISALFFYQQIRADSTLLKASFVSVDGVRSGEVKLEIVLNEAGRRRGLMFRHEMAPDRGMLFVFPGMSERGFYMKNTFIPLDMIFLDDKHIVAGVIENVPILNEQNRSLGVPSQYVIELNAGSAARLGIKKGSRVEYLGAVPKGI